MHNKNCQLLFWIMSHYVRRATESVSRTKMQESKCSQLRRQRGKTKKIEEEKEIVQPKEQLNWRTIFHWRGQVKKFVRNSYWRPVWTETDICADAWNWLEDQPNVSWIRCLIFMDQFWELSITLHIFQFEEWRSILICGLDSLLYYLNIKAIKINTQKCYNMWFTSLLQNSTFRFHE